MGRLAIIGSGAAGLAAAVTAACELRMLGVPGDVAVYEADERVGRSILATGNGRCNFSNARIDAGAYRNAAFVEAALGALAADDGLRPGGESPGSGPEGALGAAGSDPVHAFFADLGLVWREEGEGTGAAFVAMTPRAATAAANATMLGDVCQFGRENPRILAEIESYSSLLA